MTTDLKKAYSQKLEAIRPNVTGVDKLKAVADLGLSRPTIDKYLSGNVAKIDVAERILKYLSEKVDRRISELKQTVA